jgi:hypothetical protein
MRHRFPLRPAGACALMLSAAGFMATPPAGAADEAAARYLAAVRQVSPVIAKAMRDVDEAIVQACARRASVGELKALFIRGGPGEQLAALVYARAPFAAAGAAGLQGPALSLDEAWRAVHESERGHAAFAAWRDTDYEAALAAAAARACRRAASN